MMIGVVVVVVVVVMVMLVVVMVSRRLKYTSVNRWAEIPLRVDGSRASRILSRARHV